MKRRCLIIILPLLLTLSASGQGLQQYIINRKSVSLGVSLIGIEAKALNLALLQAGYPIVPTEISVATVSVSTDFGPRWGLFYSTDLSTTKSGSSPNKYLHLQYHRFYGGVEFSAFRHERFELLGRIALSYSTATLRLYDTLVDTSSFTNYLAGMPDAKRFTAGRMGMDVGFQGRLRITNFTWLGIGGGYIIPLGKTDWTHDAGNFDGGLNAGLGSWYVGMRMGILFHRRIERISPREFEEQKEDRGWKMLTPAT